MTWLSWVVAWVRWWVVPSARKRAVAARLEEMAEHAEALGMRARVADLRRASERARGDAR